MRARRSPAALAAALSGLALGFGVVVGQGGCGPSDPLEHARELQEAGRHAESLEPLREWVDLHPDDYEAQARYGIALMLTGQRALAVWPLQRAMESPEWREHAALPLVEVFTALGSYEDAVRVADEVIERNPDDVNALLLRATVRMDSRRDYEGALADADRVLEIDPENVQALVPRAVSLLALGRVDEAAETIDRLEGQYRDESLGLHGSAGMCVAQASFAREKGELDRAEELYERCLESFPTHGTVVGDALAFFEQRRKPERIEEILRTAVEQAPEAHAYRGSLVMHLRARGRKEEAEAIQRAGTQVEAPLAAAEAWAGLGTLLIEDERYDEAVEAYQRARVLDRTRSPQLVFAHADALVIAGRHEQALALAKTLSVPAHRELIAGRVALARRDPRRALAHFDRGMEHWPNNAIARYYAGVAAERAGNFGRAIEEYRYAMRIDVTPTDAYLRVARLYAALGRFERALWALTFQPGLRPDEYEAALFHVQVLARVDKLDQSPVWVKGLLERPGRPGPAAAAMAAGRREAGGPEAAIALLEGLEGVKLDHPRNADALEALIENLADAGRLGEARERVAAALRKHPDAAVLHALAGRAHERAGDAAAARAAFDRAIELDADEVRANAGLARLAFAGGDAEAAVALYERALAAAPGDRDLAFESVDPLLALGRGDEAVERLYELLDERPHDARVAGRLASIVAERGEAGAGALELARRAVRFGGGEEAKQLLERLESAGG